MNEWTGLLLAAGGVILALATWTVIDVIGLTAAEAGKDAVLRRPGFAERRAHARGWLVSGYASLLLAGTAGLLALAALTSGDPTDQGSGRLLAVSAGTLAALGVALLGSWWRRAGRPRHF